MNASDDQDRPRVALVTAGSQGLGLGCAEELAASGCTVVLCGRTPETVEAAAAGIRAAGGDAHGVVADITSPDDLAALYATVDREHGHLDVLVANAGGPPHGGFEDLGDDDWAVGIELVLMSVVRSVRLAIPRLAAAGGGRIVVIGSSSVRRPIPSLALSNTLRPGLAGLVKTLAVELADRGITANLVAPGRIATARVRALDEATAARTGTTVEEARVASVASIPAGRYGEPRELGGVVAFLASPAAAYVSGQTILVDGGMVPTLP